MMPNQMIQQQSETSAEQQRGIKRPYNGAEDISGNDGVNAENGQQQHSELGASLDYIYAELLHKNLSDHATEFYTEACRIINKYSEILSNEGQPKNDAVDGDI